MNIRNNFAFKFYEYYILRTAIQDIAQLKTDNNVTKLPQKNRKFIQVPNFFKEFNRTLDLNYNPNKPKNVY